MSILTRYPSPDIERIALAVIVVVGIIGLGLSDLKSDRIIL
jgi:hypothetical protein